MIDLALLKHFIAVAHTGSFTRASAQLHTSQSVVSRSIQRLESDIGTALFVRTTRNVRLTPAGQAFLAEALAIVDRLAVATSNAQRIGQGAATRLSIGVCPSTESETLQISRGLLVFRNAWPEVTVTVRAEIGTHLLQALRAAEIDVGILQPTRFDREGLEWRSIARARLMVAIPRVWNLRKKRLRLEELRERPWIMPNPKLASAQYDRLVNLCRTAGFEPRIVALTEDRITSRIMIGSGLGAAFVHVSKPHDADEYELVALDHMPGVFATETIIAWAAGSSSTHIRDFARNVVDAAEFTTERRRSRSKAAR
jgi:DNA-binding transcriptional LysR family regulator